MAFVNLKVPVIDEGSCLLLNYALEIIRSADQEVVVFHYPAEQQCPSESGSVGGIGKKVNLLNGRVELYDENESPTKIKPEYLPRVEETSIGREIKAEKIIIVFDFVGCVIEDARVFINAVVETLQLSNSNLESSPVTDPQEPPSQTGYAAAADVLAAASLDHHKPRRESHTPVDFITGISLRGAIEPHKFLTLFVSIPYLGTGGKSTLSESQTLQQYRLRRPAMGSFKSLPDQILVHKAWLFIFDDATIGIFRSEDDQNSNRAPLFPYQRRGCAFLASVHIIFNILTSSEHDVMAIFRDMISLLELDEGNDEGYSDPAPASESLDLVTMTQVVRSQITYLEQLRLIFQNSYPGLNPRARGDQYPLPFIENRQSEMGDAIQSLTGIITEREKFYRYLGNMMKELDLLRAMVLNRSRAKMQGRTQAYLEQQGQIISIVNLMTIVFLPLGFLASYYAANFHGTSVSTRGFWNVSAPIAIILFFLSSTFLYGKDDGIKLWLKERISPRLPR